MSKKHTYRTATTWTGNLGEGTSSYTAYLRNFTVSAEGKPDLHGSPTRPSVAMRTAGTPKKCC